MTRSWIHCRSAPLESASTRQRAPLTVRWCPGLVWAACSSVQFDSVKRTSELRPSEAVRVRRPMFQQHASTLRGAPVVHDLQPPRIHWVFAVSAVWLGAFVLYSFNLLGVYEIGRNFGLLAIFLTFNLGALWFGAKLGGGVQIRPIVIRASTARRLFVGGLLVSIVLLPLMIAGYTGNSVADIPSLAVDPVRAYSDMHGTVTQDRTERLDLLIVRGLFSWLTVLVLPLGLMLAREREIAKWPLVVAYAVPIVFSVARGTDKEIVDAALITICTLFLYRPRKLTAQIRRIPVRKILAGLLILIVVSVIFGVRRSERLESVSVHCFQNTSVCTVLPDPSSDPGAFLATLSYRYVSQGYNGLAAAFDADADACPVVGHSRPLAYLGEVLGYQCDRTLVSQLGSVGWTSRGAWSTGFVDLGNEFGLWFVPLMMIGFGAFTAALHSSTRRGRCYVLQALFVYNLYSLFYMIANLQLAQTGEMYFGYLSWCAMVLIANIMQGGR